MAAIAGASMPASVPAAAPAPVQGELTYGSQPEYFWTVLRHDPDGDDSMCLAEVQAYADSLGIPGPDTVDHPEDRVDEACLCLECLEHF